MSNVNPAVQAAYAALKIGAKEMLQRSGQDCDMPDCEFYSIGFRCSDCSRNVCNSHLYFKLGTSNKPMVMCPSCIVDENPELFVDGPISIEAEIVD